MPCAARPSHSSEDGLSLGLHLADSPQHPVDESAAQSSVPVEGPEFLHDDGDVDEYFVQSLDLSLAEDGGIGVCVLLFAEEAAVCHGDQSVQLLPVLKGGLFSELEDQGLELVKGFHADPRQADLALELLHF